MGARRRTIRNLGFVVVGVWAAALAWATPSDLAARDGASSASWLGVAGSAAPRLRLAFDLAAADTETDYPEIVAAGVAAAEIVVSVPPVPEAAVTLDEQVRTGSVAVISVPDLPVAPVVVLAEDAVAGALQLRLGDPKAMWPTRLLKKDRDAILAAYAARKGAPLWIGRDGWNGRGLALAEQLRRAGEDGLDPADYVAPILSPAARPDTPTELAEAEIRLSAQAFLYARDARGGRIESGRLSALITPKLDLPAAETVLAALGQARDPAAVVASYQPTHAGYLALKAKLAEIRANRPAREPMVRRPERRELVTHAIAILDDVPALDRPLARLSNPRLEGDIVANMERWRWLPAEMGARYVAVNVPEFRLRLYEGGRVAHETRVITGKPETPTPVFSGVMEYAIVNPSWYIPPSILKKEILPGLAADPGYAAKRGYEVVQRGNQISVRQPPGERNALGFIKFMFPNNHAVYLHDTPNRNLFASGRRAFSHGCVRVEHPFQLADFLLGREWSEERLKRLIGRGERTIWLPEKLPVHLTYFTLSADAHGELQAHEDIYGFNRRVRTALGLGA